MSNGDTDIENKPTDMELEKEGEGGMYAESNTETYPVSLSHIANGICYMTQGTQTGAL